MKLKYLYYTLLLLLMPLMAMAQGSFTLGADISGCTEMESKGQKLYNYLGEERDAFQLMKEMGLKAVRLRVWVDPTEHGGWCNKEDVVNKALRAKEQGMDIMIDFHYSDWWADPAKQDIPAAWAKHNYKKLLADVTAHTTDILSALKEKGVDVRWVQVGNETTNGFLWPAGKLPDKPKQYAGLFSAGYDAVKSVYPDAKVIVHLDKGDLDYQYESNLDALKDNGAKWDIIGMSLYPHWARDYETNVPRLFTSCIRNIKSLYKKYGTPCMIVETGYEVNEEEPWMMMEGKEQLAELIRLCKTATDGHCLGVFYWEPTCRPSAGYKLGAFTESGKPTEIMRAFTNAVQNTDLDILPECRKDIKYDRKMIEMQVVQGYPVTPLGIITMELYNETPLHRDNYLALAKSHALDSILFHRVIPNFMIQCGDPTSKTADATTTDSPADPLGNENVKGADGKAYTIPAEIRYPQFFHKRGAVAAARADDDKNPKRESSSSQFYIVWGKWPVAKKAGSSDDPLTYYLDQDNAGVPYLDNAYTVFGEVTQGLDVVDKIQKARRDPYDRPVDDIRILKLRIKE